MNASVKTWFRSGVPWIWLNAAAVSISILMVTGLLLLLAIRGLSHFWPRDVVQLDYLVPAPSQAESLTQIIGEIVDAEEVSATQLDEAGIEVDPNREVYGRQLIKLGNRDLTGTDFTWIVAEFAINREYPEHLVTLERREWGNFYGYLLEVREGDVTVARAEEGTGAGESAWAAFGERLERSRRIHEQILAIEKSGIGDINYRMERLRLRERRLQLEGEAATAVFAGVASERAEYEARYETLRLRLAELNSAIERDSALFEAASGRQIEIQLADVVRAYRANAMNPVTKLGVYLAKLGEFLTDEPREANTEGGIFPAIFGTVMMVLIMSVFVTPFGVIAAVYLREYARQGFLTGIIRIAVNNLAGVPSIVYGVFGLGFFIYVIGGEIDQLFYPEALPAPTFGTPGLLWASLTLALLTLPVVIVATEEGLARVPRSLREGSMALGATKFETLWHVVLPMASPAMMTGLILAVARAAGEVAPLMLVGVVKLAPSLPVDGNFPYLHLDQKIMHLGFHIYDVGFQSPNIEAARSLVYATALLLVVVIALLNLSAVALRNHLRERYKTLEVE